MKNVISILFVILISFGITMSDAYAKRFGGGRSFGMSRSVSSFSRATPSSNGFQRSAPINNARPGNKWLGPLAGLALGGLLTSLFMGHGIGSGIMSWLLIAGIVMLILNFARGFMQNRMQSAPPAPVYNLYRENALPSASQNTFHYAPDFNETEFLRIAKVQFIRLQAAYDQKNLQDIGQFTTPEVFAEIKLDLQERGDKPNQTDVVTLDAKLLDVATENNGKIASVEFSGLIKEEPGQPAASFKEIWHFVKETHNENWLTSGIQQNH